MMNTLNEIASFLAMTRYPLFEVSLYHNTIFLTKQHNLKKQKWATSISTIKNSLLARASRSCPKSKINF